MTSGIAMLRSRDAHNDHPRRRRRGRSGSTAARTLARLERSRERAHPQRLGQRRRAPNLRAEDTRHGSADRPLERRGNDRDARRSGRPLMLVDANLLLYAVDRGSSFHQAARSWLTEQLTGARRVGLPWQSLAAFLRIATHPRAFERPLDPADAWRRVTDWLN